MAIESVSRVPLRLVPSDEEALCALVPRVRAWLHRDFGPGADIDDALQDALTEIARAMEKFEGRSSLNTYAYRITARVAMKHRKKSARRPLTLASPPVDQIDPESRAMGREALGRIYAALDRLPGRRRRAFILCCIEGLTSQEAAEREGVGDDVMRGRLRDARKDVARRMAQDPYVSELLRKGRS